MAERGLDKNWAPTRCEAVVLSGALNHCLRATRRTVFIDEITGDITQGVGGFSTAAGVVSTVVGAATSTPPAYIAGAVTLGTNLVSNVKTLGSGTPPTPTPINMTSAAGSFALLNQNIKPPTRS